MIIRAEYLSQIFRARFFVPFHIKSSFGTIFKNNENLKILYIGSDDVLSLFYHHADYYPIEENDKMYTTSLKRGTGSSTYIYYIPSTLTEIHLLNEIESYSLCGMKSIERVYITSKLTEFGEGAFSGCSGLKYVDFAISTDGDWEYNYSFYNYSEYGIVSMADMNSPAKLAEQLKLHGRCRWTKQ